MRTHVPLSISRIKEAKAIGHDVWLSDDDGTRGAGRLVLRVTTAGAKRFYFRPSRSKDSRESTIPLGLYSRTKKPNRLTLAEARHTAATLSASRTIRMLPTAELARLARGGLHKPATDETRGPSMPRNEPPMASGAEHSTAGGSAVRQEPSHQRTLTEVCEDYAKGLHSAGKVSAREVENTFKRFIYGTELGGMLATEVTSEQFLTLLRRLIDSPRAQRKFRSYLYSAYAKAIRAKNDMQGVARAGDSGISVNPIAPIESSAQKTNARTRYLQIPELRALWQRLQLTRDNFGSLPLRAARLALLLGGQRCVQLARVPRDRLDIEAGTILLLDPKGRRATPRLHLLPLAPQARAELTWLNNHSFSVGSPFVFAGTDSSKHLSTTSVSNLVTALCHEMQAARQCEKQFQFSDVRRTAETQLAALGVPSEIRKRIQSHDLSGVQDKHYNMHEYFKEKYKALLLWERFLNSLLDGTEAPHWDEDLTLRKKAKSPARRGGATSGAS